MNHKPCVRDPDIDNSASCLQDSGVRKNRTVWKYLAPVSAAVMFMILIACPALSMGTRQETQGKGLYLYTNREVLRFLNAIGYSDDSILESPDISRNSDGSALRFVDRERKLVIIVACDGSIRHQEVPGYPVWFNDEHQAVAWHHRDSGTVHYRNGITEKIVGSFPPSRGPDPSGSYFMKFPPIFPPRPLNLKCITTLYSIENPDVPIAELAMCGVQKIFLKDAKIFVFGKDFSHHENTVEKRLTAHIFQNRNGEMIEVQQIKMKPPGSRFYAVDLSPWTDEVLLIHPRDFPSRSVWHVFDLNTREMKTVGKEPYSGGWGFYLQCDIIAKVSEELARSRNSLVPMVDDGRQ